MVDALSFYIQASLIKSLRPQHCNMLLRNLSVFLFSKELKHIFSWGQKRVSAYLNIYFVGTLKHEFKVNFVLSNFVPFNMNEVAGETF